jgi:hypothetical protein
MTARQAITRVQMPDSSISFRNADGIRLGKKIGESSYGLPTPLSESAEMFYSDSRRLETTCNHFITDYRLSKSLSNRPDVGIDGFTTVSSGFKPSVASTKLYIREYSDFYRFQVKDGSNFFQRP